MMDDEQPCWTITQLEPPIVDEKAQHELQEANRVAFMEENQKAELVVWEQVADEVLRFLRKNSYYFEIRKEKYFRYIAVPLFNSQFKGIDNAFEITFECPHEITVTCYVCATPLKILKEFSVY